MRIIVIVLLALISPLALAQEANKQPELQSLSGKLTQTSKPAFRYALKIDGGTGTMDLKGDGLTNCRLGDRVMLKGAIKTRLINADAKPDAPQQQATQWQIYMDVSEAKKIESAFGLEDK